MAQSLSAAPMEGPATIALGDILAGLSHALDITEGQERGHTARACLIGMRLADLMGLSSSDHSDLFYALLIKDAGGSGNASHLYHVLGSPGGGQEPPGISLRDWRSLARDGGYAHEYAKSGGTIWDRIAQLGHLAQSGRQGRRSMFRIRSNRGASLAVGLGLSIGTANAVRSMDEHWDGGGDPTGLQGEAIPMLARIIGLAQVAEVFSRSQGEAVALDVIERRRNRWFDPTLVDAFGSLVADLAFWQSLRRDDPAALISRVEPTGVGVVADESRLDQIADAFASLIDAKSPYTSDHSRRVARLSVNIGERLGFSPSALTRLRRAALLHDIGKLGVPSVVLEKPGPLTPDEWVLVKRHPSHTLQILQAVPGFSDFAFDAACHHEKLDGSGYHCGYSAERLSATARVLTVADMADALMTDRPYRQGLDPFEALHIIHTDCQAGQLCPNSVGALTDYIAEVLSQPQADDSDDDDDQPGRDHSALNPFESVDA